MRKHEVCNLLGNLRLQDMMRTMAEQRNGKLHTADERYCIDNGLMIACAGLLQYAAGTTTSMDESTITQRYRTDAVFVNWRK